MVCARRLALANDSDDNKEKGTTMTNREIANRILAYIEDVDPYHYYYEIGDREKALSDLASDLTVALDYLQESADDGDERAEQLIKLVNDAPKNTTVKGDGYELTICEYSHGHYITFGYYGSSDLDSDWMGIEFTSFYDADASILDVIRGEEFGDDADDGDITITCTATGEKFYTGPKWDATDALVNYYCDNRTPIDIYNACVAAGVRIAENADDSAYASYLAYEVTTH